MQRGRHTTRHTELFSLPKGGLLADTPGFNKPEFRLNTEILPRLFPQIRLQLERNKCKFRDCLHLDEPGCAISKDWERYQDYKNFLQEIISSHR